MDTVLITGGTGLVARKLTEKLMSEGYSVSILSRSGNKTSEIRQYQWDPDKEEVDKESVEKADYIIHLAGAGVGDKRWSQKRKKEIIDSRVKTAELLLKAINESGTRIKSFISISGTGYYGTNTSEKIFIEADPPASDFLGETCRLWEEAADRFAETGARVVKLRAGIVLSGRGGVLKRIITPVRFGIGSAIGSGKQYVPWIHIDDLCQIFIKAIEDQNIKGVYNAVAPDHITNRDLMRSLSEVCRKPFWFPAIPEFLMKMIFGEMSGILLEGSRVSSEKILSAGYSFRYPGLCEALEEAVRG